MISTSVRKIPASFLLLASLFLLPGNSSALASLSEKQARNLIRRMTGVRLPGNAVNVKGITENSSGAEARVEIETAFRLMQDEQNHWQVAEVRTGQDQWEEIPLIAAAIKRQLPETKCAAPDLSARTAAGNVSAKRARCLIASLLRIELPSDAVRIRSLSTLDVPFTSQPSALVEALVRFDFRFRKEKGGWRLTEMRSGDAEWVNVEATLEGINEAKRQRTQKELATMARALEEFRRNSGFYVTSDEHQVLIDHLSPRFLVPIIRFDPWRNPYRYQGARDRYLLRSDGPDGRENTTDDIVVNRVSN